MASLLHSDRAYLGCPLWKQRHENGVASVERLGAKPGLAVLQVARRAGMWWIKMVGRVLTEVRKSGWIRAAAVACIVLIAILSLIPGNWQRRTGLPGPVEHFMAYFATGAILAIALPERRSPFWAAAALFAYAGLLEVLQNFSPGRDPSVTDAVVSGAGALAGIFTIWTISKVN